MIEKAQISARAQSVVDSWVDERFGPIHSFTEMRGIPPEPDWWVTSCSVARCPVGTRFSNTAVFGAGSSINRATALERALFESVERYTALQIPDEEVNVRPIRKSDEVSLRFASCAREEDAPAAFVEVPFDKPVSHVQVSRLTDGSTIEVPAAFVWLQHLLLHEEVALCHPISTGWAFHTELDKALLGGICEVLERDAIMLAWLNRWCSTRIDAEDAASPELADRILRLGRARLRPRLYDITTSAIPAVLAIIESDKIPYITIGASCKPDLDAACCKALDEAVSIRRTVFASSKQAADTNNLDWVRSLEDHAWLYAHWQNSPALDFLHPDRCPVTPLSTLIKEYRPSHSQQFFNLPALAGELEKEGLSVFWSNQTCEEVVDFGHVTRVLIPEALPLNQIPSLRWLGSSRMHSWMQKLKRKAADLNPYPHPFA